MSRASSLTGADREEVLRTLRALDASLAGTGEGLLAFDLEYRYLFWNDQMEKLTGRSEADLLGARVFDAFPFVREIGADRPMAEALDGRPASSRGQPFVIPDTGRRGVYDGFYAPLSTHDGRIVGATGIIRDLTARRQELQKLAETETRFQSMADVAPVLLWMSGTDGLCTFFNQTWLTFTGRTMQEEWGVGWAEGVHFEDFQHCMDTFTEYFNKREVFEMEYRLRRADGEFRWVLDRGRPRFSPDGTFLGYIGSCVDITDRKNVELQLRKAVRDRDDFLSIAAHELRTPLTALHLTLEKLERVVLKDPEEALRSGRLSRASVAAASQADRLTTLVNELLDISRLTSGRIDLELEQTNLSDLVHAVVKRLKPALDDKGATLQIQGPPAINGRWDIPRLDQVITNLVGNAIKYGDGKPIEVTLTADDTDARILVRDQGIGIAKADQGRIFERFERAVSTRNYGGFGLGLWISRQVLTALGGSISVESELGQGALFTVRLPLSPALAEGVYGGVAEQASESPVAVSNSWQRV